MSLLETVNPYIPVLKLAAFAAFILAAFVGGYHMGGASARAELAEERATLNAESVRELEKARADAERFRGEIEGKFAALNEAHQKQLKERDNEKAAALRDARARGMFVNARCQGDPGSPAAPAATASGSDGSTRVRLSDPDAEFLVAFASDADAVADQLRACQSVISAYREQRLIRPD